MKGLGRITAPVPADRFPSIYLSRQPCAMRIETGPDEPVRRAYLFSSEPEARENDSAESFSVRGTSFSARSGAIRMGKRSRRRRPASRSGAPVQFAAIASMVGDARRAVATRDAPSVRRGSMRSMPDLDARLVDPRDSHWELWHPAYRVSLWTRSGDA